MVRWWEWWSVPAPPGDYPAFEERRPTSPAPVPVFESDHKREVGFTSRWIPPALTPEQYLPGDGGES